LETYTEFRDFIDHPGYHDQRRQSLRRLDIDTIDTPIVQIIRDITKLPYCFTLQSCYGHFLYPGQEDTRDMEPLPVSGDIKHVDYRIAYIAVCIQNCDVGRALLDDLKDIPAIDPAYIQFGCADWFWNTHPNSYVLQVEPERHKTKDRATVDYDEALHIEQTRNEFFGALTKLIQERPG
jgi:hypothetical protein